jgi:hypothetical protein
MRANRLAHRVGAMVYVGSVLATGCASSSDAVIDLHAKADGVCSGTATFDAPAGWTVNDSSTLIQPDLGVSVTGLCRTRDFAQDELDYVGPWTLGSVDTWFAVSSGTRARAFTVDGRPAHYRHRTIDLAATLEVAVATTMVSQTFVAFTAEVPEAATTRSRTSSLPCLVVLESPCRGEKGMRANVLLFVDRCHWNAASSPSGAGSAAPGGRCRRTAGGRRPVRGPRSARGSGGR